MDHAMDRAGLDSLRARVRAIEGGGVDFGREVARLGPPLDAALPWGGLPYRALHEVGGVAAPRAAAGGAPPFPARGGGRGPGGAARGGGAPPHRGGGGFPPPFPGAWRGAGLVAPCQGRGRAGRTL